MKFLTTAKLSENIRETPEGYLVCVGVPIARTGEMVYGNGETPLDVGPDGIVIIQRDQKEVFRPETMASFEGKSITIQHPKGFVNPKNWAELTHGIVQNVRRGKGENENDLLADFLVTDDDAIQMVRNGLREVSCGYEAEYIQSGIGRGIQKNIIGNHVALVKEGRAGSSYAINDHKGKGLTMTALEIIKKAFKKAEEEAVKAATTDLAGAGPVESNQNGAQVTGYDALMKAVNDLGTKMDAMVPKAKDVTSPATENKPAETVVKDDEAGIGDRLAKLEAICAKLMASMPKTGDADGEACDDDYESSEMVGDDDGDDGDADTEDADSDEDDEFATGDAASRIEILAPGMKLKGKDFKVKALKAAYATTDGKAVINQFTAGKSPDFKNEKFADVLFTAASEILKGKRAKDLAGTRTYDFQSTLGVPKGARTPEQINEANAKFYASRTTH